MGLTLILAGILVVLVGVLTCIDIEKQFKESYGGRKKDDNT